jgi:hypothetical protein
VDWAVATLMREDDAFALGFVPTVVSAVFFKAAMVISPVLSLKGGAVSQPCMHMVSGL